MAAAIVTDTKNFSNVVVGKVGKFQNVFNAVCLFVGNFVKDVLFCFSSPAYGQKIVCRGLECFDLAVDIG